MKDKIPIKHICTECGRPEKSKYKPAPNTDFICSTCVQNRLIKKANEEKEEVEKEERLKKRVKRAEKFKKRL